MRILLVDDNDAVRNATKRMLTLAGHEITAFAVPAEAVDAFRAAPDAFDGVLLDVNIGDEDGVALSITLRALHQTIPIAFMTGSDTSAVRARAHGVVLTKPCSPNDLLALVDSWRLQ